MTPTSENTKELFLRACRFEPTERVPVWIMRQAGRYLPEYQAVRAKHTFLEICKTPELAAEVSIQPHRVLGVDAIIVFSDILIVAEAMGMPLDVPDSGPVLSNPVRDAAAVARLREFDPERETRFVGDAIRAICKAAGPTVPVIGFAAAPWTLACYMIEGRTRGDISRAKQMLREEPEVVRELLERIARATARYLKSADRGRRCGRAAIRHLGRRTFDRGIRRVRDSRDADDFAGTGRRARAEDTVCERIGAAPGKHGEVRRRCAERGLAYRSCRGAKEAWNTGGAARKR